MTHSEETKRKISETLKRKGIKPTVLPSREQCVANLGSFVGGTPWNKGKKGSQRAWNIGLKGYKSGEANARWKGGVTSTNSQIRNSFEMKEWRKEVFERDDFTCQACGKHGGDMEADHVMPFAQFPELRFDVLNGRTLCPPCHRATFLSKNMLRQLTATYN